MRLTFTLLGILFFAVVLNAQMASPAISSHKTWNMSSDQSYLGSCLVYSDIGLAGYITDPTMTYTKGFCSVLDSYSNDTVAYYESTLANPSLFHSVAICDGCNLAKSYPWPVIAAGYSESAPGDRNLYVYFHDNLNGTFEFVDTLPNNQEIMHIKQEFSYSPNFYFCGYNEQSPGNKDMWIGLINTPGFTTPSITYSQTFGGTGDDVLNSFDVSSNSSLMVAGYTTSYPSAGKDLKLIMFDPGNQLVIVDTAFHIPGDQELLGLAYSDYYAGNFLGVGYSDTTGTNKDMFLVAFDEYTGDTLWTRTVGTPYEDVATSVRYVSTGMLVGYVVSGYSLNANGEKEIHMYFVDPYGWIMSERKYGIPGTNIEINTMEALPDGCNYFLFGEQGVDQVSYAMAAIDYTVDVIDVSCYGSADGEISYNDLMSNYPNIILWDSLYSTQIGTGYYYSFLDTGKYFMDIDYMVGGGAKQVCLLTDSFFIHQPDSFVYSFTLIDPNCYDSNGEITGNFSGGVLPYDIYWTTTGADSLNLTGLSSGSYNVTATDWNGCFYLDTTLTLNPHAMPYVYGNAVTATFGLIAADHATATIFRYGNTGGAAMLDSVDSYVIDAANQYQFDIDTGSYMIKITVDSTSYYPHVMNSYYSLNDTVMTWEMADVITVNCDDTLNADVNMYEMNAMENGIGAISGYIYLYTYSSKAVGEPVPGAEILIEQEPNDIPVQSAYTDPNGFYSITGLESGFTYSMHVDIPGYPMINTYTNIPITTSDTIYEEMNFYVDTTLNGGIMADTLQTGSSPVSIGNFAVNTYPNPFNDYINININLNKDAFLWIDVINIKGEEVDVLSNEKVMKNNYVKNWNPKLNLPSGTYFLRIRVDNEVLIKKIVYQK